MALRRKQEEKNLALLRELAALTHNKQCFDCGQRGPTYVNMTIGSFVCTSCSGRLRGLTPPHRVKSISMASFSAEEIEFIKQRGNEWCRAVWLGLFDSSRHPDIDTKDDQQIKDFMAVKYEKKRYYVDPSVAFKERPAGGQSSPPASSAPAAAPAPAAVAPVTTTSTGPLPSVRPLSKLAGGPVKPITLNQNVPLPGPTRPTERNNFDLLADLSPVTSAAQADPFSPSGGGGARPAPAAAATPANFANFANFDALNAAAPATGSGGGFANFGSSAALAAVPLSTPAPAPATAAPPASGDRYAALKELDEVLKAEVEPKVDWGAAHREPAVPPGPAWSAFGAVSNGGGPYGASPQQAAFGGGGGAISQPVYGASPQQAAFGGGGGAISQPVYGASPQQHMAAFPPTSQFAAPVTNGFVSGNPWHQQPAPVPGPVSAYSPYPGYAAYRQPYPAPQYGGPATDMSVAGFGASNGTPSLRPGGWGSPGQQQSAWAAAPPSANPFMSSNGAAQPVNPHNPFL